MENDELLHAEVTEAIIGAFFHVYNSLGVGFLEKVYQNAMAVSLRKQGFDVKTEFPIHVRFEGEIVGKYSADLLVANCVIVEIKRSELTIDAHEAQLANYLKATHVEVGLLLHFGNKPSFRRRIYMNDKKPHLKITSVPP
ncbi:MAG: GxxExxY protein [Planctomycetaceae bacterium]